MVRLLAIISGACISLCYTLDSHRPWFWIVMTINVMAVATLRGIR